MDLLRCELPRDLGARTLPDVCLDQCLLDLDLLIGKLEEAFLEYLIADAAKEIRHPSGGFGGAA